MKYRHIAIGGTFDLLHKGHEQFIRSAFSFGERVTIGVTSDELVRKLKGGSYQNFDDRLRAVCEFIKTSKLLAKTSVMRLDDFFGPTLSDKTIDCLFVTRDSLSGAKIINKARAKVGLKNLQVETFLLIKGTDKKVISSRRIKAGTISQEGLNYFDYLVKKGDLHLPQHLREVLRKPFGKVYNNLKDKQRVKNNKTLIATVGDFTTKSFLDSGTHFNLAIIDLKIQRINSFKNAEALGFTGKEKIIKVVNPPGIISTSLIKGIRESLTRGINNKTIVLVNGEEDLAVLVLCLLAPLGSIIYYGLWNKGLVEVNVDLNLKTELLGLINLFEKR